MDRLTISVEKEGLDVELKRVFVDDMEVNIYSAVDDICVIGEATVRFGTRLVKELKGKIETIRRSPIWLSPR